MGGYWGLGEGGRGDSKRKRLGLSERYPSWRKHGTASRTTGRCSANKNLFFVLFYTTCAVPRPEDRGANVCINLFGSAERGRGRGRRPPCREHRANPVLATSSLETCLLAASAHLISLSKLGFLKVKNRGGGGGGGGGGDCFALRLDTRYDRGDGLLFCAKDSGVSEPVIRVWSHFADSDKRMTSKRYDLQCRSFDYIGFCFEILVERVFKFCVLVRRRG